ncbi:MAG: RelA/SpoT domain-containing protein [Formosimonas sp.]
MELDFSDDGFAEQKEAFDILVNWRASHAYPMQTVLNQFRRKAFFVDSTALVAQRLKRTPSIIAKLKREKMELDRVDDIAGCRAILSDIDAVYALRDAMLHSKTKNKLKRERDYIKSPKNSGYRGVHLVYSYQGGKVEYLGLPVELQIRSKIQHSWATAVEVVGTFLQEPLKSGIGDEEWLYFFKLVGDAFYSLETGQRHEHIAELNQLYLQMQVSEKLTAFSVATNMIAAPKSTSWDFYIVILDIEHRKVRAIPFDDNDWDRANKLYANYEEEFKNDPTKDVVLVSTDSVDGLKRAFPNYFADTVEFMKNLKLTLGISNAN